MASEGIAAQKIVPEERLKKARIARSPEHFDLPRTRVMNTSDQLRNHYSAEHRSARSKNRLGLGPRHQLKPKEVPRTKGRAWRAIAFISQ